MNKILITGGTGSFGGMAVKHLLADPKTERVVVFSRDELKQHVMRSEYKQDVESKRLDFIVGDIRDKEAVDNALCNIDVVFHAAALKQVPTGEFFPMEMLRTNVMGTHNVIEAARKNGVQKLVFLSTDKAVYPINVLGFTKALAEKLVMSHSRTSAEPIFCTVRYGNVMASRGSVIPLFVDQILHGKPLTITHSGMTRFMLTLEDAMGLVLLAIEKGEQGDLFVRKAPATTIGNVANALVDIFEVKNEIKEIGIRAGEKLHETLVAAGDLSRAVDLGDFYRIPGATGDYDTFYSEGVAKQIPTDFTSENARQLTLAETKEMLLALPYIQEALRDK